jgi:hypothetical protein
VSEAVEAVHQIDRISRSHCRVWALTHFTQEKMVRDYLVLYQQMLSHR